MINLQDAAALLGHCRRCNQRDGQHRRNGYSSTKYTVHYFPLFPRVAWPWSQRLRNHTRIFHATKCGVCAIATGMPRATRPGRPPAGFVDHFLVLQGMDPRRSVPGHRHQHPGIVVFKICYVCQFILLVEFARGMKKNRRRSAGSMRRDPGRTTCRPDNRSVVYLSSQASSMRQPLYMLFTWVVRPLT